MRGTIEVAPLAYMRGRRLRRRLLILDEAQNATPEQIEDVPDPARVRIQVVVPGNVAQVDLPGGQRSGTAGRCGMLGDVDDVLSPS